MQKTRDTSHSMESNVDDPSVLSNGRSCDTRDKLGSSHIMGSTVLKLLSMSSIPRAGGWALRCALPPDDKARSGSPGPVKHAGCKCTA